MISHTYYFPIILKDFAYFTNGDFETNSFYGWNTERGPFQGHGSGLLQAVVTFENSKNARLGYPLSRNGAIPVGYGVISQTFTLEERYLQIRYRVLTYDIVKGQFGYVDTFEVSLNTPPSQIRNSERDSRGCDNESSGILNPKGMLTPTNDGLILCGGYSGSSADVGTLRDLGWNTVTLDLRSFQNQSVMLYFALWSREYTAPYRDDKAFYNTWVYIDNVRSLHVQVFLPIVVRE
jgi:hypothetical protein